MSSDVERVLREATPRPWQFDGEKVSEVKISPTNAIICLPPVPYKNGIKAWQQNGELIVLAVNSYEPLREALGKCERALAEAESVMRATAIGDQCRAALAQARKVLGGGE